VHDGRILTVCSIFNIITSMRRECPHPPSSSVLNITISHIFSVKI
jgi:hypothetical protein